MIRSRKEQDELDKLRENGKLQVSYPFTRDPRCLPNNRKAVIKMAEKQEKRMIKAGFSDKYNE